MHSAKVVDFIQPLTNFEKHFILGVSQGYEYASDKAKQNPGAFSHIPQKIRTGISANFFHIYIQYYIHITLWLGILNCQFNTRVSDFKLIHPCSWIHMLISQYLPVQTHHNICRPNFSNFFGKVKKFKVNYTMLF